MLESVVLEHFEELFVGSFDGEVETQRLEEDVFIVHDRVFPFPKVFGLFVDDDVGVLLRDTTAGYHDVFYLTAAFFNFCGEKETSRANGLMIY